MCTPKVITPTRFNQTTRRNVCADRSYVSRSTVPERIHVFARKRVVVSVPIRVESPRRVPAGAGRVFWNECRGGERTETTAAVEKKADSQSRQSAAVPRLRRRNKFRLNERAAGRTSVWSSYGWTRKTKIRSPTPVQSLPYPPIYKCNKQWQPAGHDYFVRARACECGHLVLELNLCKSARVVRQMFKYNYSRCVFSNCVSWRNFKTCFNELSSDAAET